MLQEIGFLVLFLPATQLLPDLRATALPLPTVAFMLRMRLVPVFEGSDDGVEWKRYAYRYMPTSFSLGSAW